jgi:hypothetical protein
MLGPQLVVLFGRLRKLVGEAWLEEVFWGVVFEGCTLFQSLLSASCPP